MTTSAVSAQARPPRWLIARLPALVAVAAAILLFLALWVRQSGKPLQLDDVDHFGIARAILETGRPVYYRGEALPALSGALHPPLNDYLLAGWLALWGAGRLQAKALSLLCTFAQGGVAMLLARSLLRPGIRQGLLPWFWALFLLNPYTLQLSSMVDIDAATYGPWLGLLLWSVVRLHWQEGERRETPPRVWEFALVALLLTACLWTKLTTVLLAIPFLFLLLLPTMGLRRAWWAAATTSAAGLALFIGSYWPACRAWGLDPLETLAFARRMATTGGRLATPLHTFAYMAAQLARWTGLLPWIALAAALAWSWRAATRKPRDPDSPAAEIFLLLALAGASIVWYCATRVNFANAPFKYTFVYYALVSMTLAVLASRPGDGASGIAVRWAVAVLAVTSGVTIALGLLRDTVVQHGWNHRSAVVLGLPAAVGALGCLGILLGEHRAPRARILLRAALCFHLGVQGGVAWVQARSDYSTTYDYGQRGLAAAARFVREHTSGDGVISSMKDLGVLAGRRYIENYAALYGGEAEVDRLLGAWQSGRVELIVFTEGIGPDPVALRPRLAEWLERNAELVASLGNYRIYRPLGATAAPRRQAT